MTKTKICSKCSKEKPLQEFWNPGRICKECKAIYGKERYKKNKEKCKLSNKRWKSQNPDASRNSMYRCTYGISLEEYNALLTKQGGVCPICLSSKSGAGSRPLHVDHNHKTGKVRGLLCVHCNLGLGCFKDSPNLLRAALEYLENSSE